MKCFKHNAAAAVAVCAHCGRAICPACIASPTAARIVCSEDCSRALVGTVEVMQLLLDKNAQSARASAFYCYLTAGLSAGATVAAWFMLPSPFLIYFTAACAVALAVSGFWHSRVAQRQDR